MEGFDSVWQVFLLSLCAGALIGALAYRFFNPVSKQLDQMKSDRDSANAELEDYKAGVGQHFDKTSQLVNDLTQNYVKVYQHLAEGAQTLGAGKSFNNLLEQNQGKFSLAVEDKSVVTEVIAEEIEVEQTAKIETPAQVEQTEEVEAPADFDKTGIEETEDSSPQAAKHEDPVATEAESTPEKPADETVEVPEKEAKTSKK